MTPLTDGRRWWVPDNRWDLARHEVQLTALDRVAVIIPYYEQPDSLRRMYAALGESHLPATWEVVVVDDGSRTAPPAPPCDLASRVRILRQEDRGVRPAAARHLGVQESEAELLVFLDPDTLPAPETIARLASWPATLPDALVVGRRTHVDVGDWEPARTAAWLRGEGPAPRAVRDPAWLDDGYRSTGDLLHADRRAYRFVISGVMACHRALYDDIGGFDVARDEYGAEDWELAARAYDGGALLVHDPLAVTYHDEPDWADRQEDIVTKQHESAWLAERITEPSARGAGLIHPTADLHTTVDLGDAPWQDWAGTVNSLLWAAPDQRIQLPATADAHLRRFVGTDPRVTIGPSPAAPRPSGAAVLGVEQPYPWTAAALAAVLAPLRDDGTGRVRAVHCGATVATATSRRLIGRLRRARGFAVDQAALAATFDERTCDLPLVAMPADLVAWLARTR